VFPAGLGVAQLSGELIANAEIPGRVAASLDGHSFPGRPLLKQSARLGTRQSSRRICGREKFNIAAYSQGHITITDCNFFTSDRINRFELQKN
jgi:hypothetical protein